MSEFADECPVDSDAASLELTQDPSIPAECAETGEAVAEALELPADHLTEGELAFLQSVMSGGKRNGGWMERISDRFLFAYSYSGMAGALRGRITDLELSEDVSFHVFTKDYGSRRKGWTFCPRGEANAAELRPWLTRLGFLAN